MKYLALICALSLTVLTVNFASAGSIKAACQKSDRSAANRASCTCIEKVANVMLTRKEKSRVAKFFKDPHKSQVLRQSDRRSDEKFWAKYKDFGQAVATHCSN